MERRGTDRPESTTRAVGSAVDGLVTAATAFSSASVQAIDGASSAFRKWNDPAARLHRKRRRALRGARLFGSATGAGAVGTATLAAASMPEATVVAAGGGTALLVVPTVLAVRAFRRLRDAPAPPPRRVGPPAGSVAHEPVRRLDRAERSLTHLLGVLDRADILPDDEIAEIRGTARAASGAIDAVVVDLVALESAAHESPAARAHVTPAIARMRAGVDAGVERYESLVAAAAGLAADGPSRRLDLPAVRDASDRLVAWSLSWRDVRAAGGA